MPIIVEVGIYVKWLYKEAPREEGGLTQEEVLQSREEGEGRAFQEGNLAA